MGPPSSAMALVRPTPVVEIPSPAFRGQGPSRRPTPIFPSRRVSVDPPQPSTSTPVPVPSPSPAAVPIAQSTSGTSTPQSHDEPARQLRRTSYRKPLRIDWSQSIWAPLGSQPLSSGQVGWSGLTCPSAQPGQYDAPLPPPESDIVGDPTSGYFFIDNASMPQARNHPWGPTPLPPSTKRIKVSRHGNIHKAYHEINAALHVDEEYDNRAVRRAILRGVGATEEDLEREDRASTVGPQSGHINPNDDMDAISRRSASIAPTQAGPSGTPRRSHSRQLSMPASIPGDTHDDDHDADGYPTIDPRIQHHSRLSLSPEDSITHSHISSPLPSRSVSAQPQPQQDPIVKAETRESPDFFIDIDLPPASSPSTQPEPLAPVPTPSATAQASTSMPPPQASPIRPPPSSAPAASQKPRRIPTTRGSRLSAAAVQRLKSRPKREARDRSQSQSKSPSSDDDPMPVAGPSSSVDDSRSSRNRARTTRRQSGPEHDELDIVPMKYDLSGWGQPTQLSSLNRSAPSSASRKRVRLEAGPVVVNGDDSSGSDDVAVEEVRPASRPRSKGKQKEAVEASLSWRVRLPSLEDSDDDDGRRPNSNIARVNGSGKNGSNTGGSSGRGTGSGSTNSTGGRQALLSHPWMARGGGNSSRPVVEIASRSSDSSSSSARRNDRPPPSSAPSAPVRRRTSLFLSSSRSSSSSPDPLDDSPDAQAQRARAQGKGRATSNEISGSQAAPIPIDLDSD